MLIGEVSRHSGVSTRMLRHYDALGLVTPSLRRSTGYREYSTDDIRRLFHVESLRMLGLSLNEVKRALDDPDFAPGDLVRDLARHTRARIAAEQELLRRLDHVEAADPDGWEEVMGVVTLLRALESDSGARRQQAVLSASAGLSAPAGSPAGGGSSAFQGPRLPVEALAEAALAEDDTNVAGALRWSLARSGGAIPSNLADGLGSPDVRIRRRAATVLAAIASPDATYALRAALEDSDAVVRDRAALALAARGVPEVVDALVEMVIAGRADIEAAEALGVLASGPLTAEEVVSALRARAETADAAPRLRITQAFAEIPGAASRQALLDLTRDPDRTIAGTATAILHSGPRRRPGSHRDVTTSE